MSQELNLFTIRSLNSSNRETAKSSRPGMLFSEFWIEGELAVLFSDAGKGKSLLAVQIAQSIASGVPVGLTQMTADPQKVLYFDFDDGFFENDDVDAKNSPPYEGGVAAVSADGVILSDENLEKELERALESRRHTNNYMQSVGLKGIGYDDIYEEFEKRRLARDSQLATQDSECGNATAMERAKLAQLGELGELTDDDEDPMARYGLTSDYDAGGTCGREATESEPGTGSDRGQVSTACGSGWFNTSMPKPRRL